VRPRCECFPGCQLAAANALSLRSIALFSARLRHRRSSVDRRFRAADARRLPASPSSWRRSDELACRRCCARGGGEPPGRIARATWIVAGVFEPAALPDRWHAADASGSCSAEPAAWRATALPPPARARLAARPRLRRCLLCASELAEPATSAIAIPTSSRYSSHRKSPF